MPPSLFHPTLKSNWKRILRKAWSSQLLMLAALLAGLEAGLPLAWETGYLILPPGWFPVIMLVVVCLALFARLLVQSGIENE